MLPFAVLANATGVIDMVFDKSNKDTKGSAKFNKYNQLDKAIGEQEPIEIEIEKIEHPVDEVTNDIGRKPIDKNNPRSLYDSLSSDNKKILESLYSNDQKINKNIENVAEGLEKVNKNIEKLQKSSELYNKMGLEGMTNVGSGGDGGSIFDKIIEIGIGLAGVWLALKAIGKFLKLPEKLDPKNITKTLDDNWKEFIKSNPFKVDVADFNSKKKELGGEYQRGAEIAKETGEHEMENMQDLLKDQAVLAKATATAHGKIKKEKNAFIESKKAELKTIQEQGSKGYQKTVLSGGDAKEAGRVLQGNLTASKFKIGEEQSNAEDSYELYDFIYEKVQAIQDYRYPKLNTLAVMTLVTQDKSYIKAALNQVQGPNVSKSKMVRTGFNATYDEKLAKGMDGKVHKLTGVLYLDTHLMFNSGGENGIHSIRDERDIDSLDFYDLAAIIIKALRFPKNWSIEKIKDLYILNEKEITDLAPFAINSFKSNIKFVQIKENDKDYDYKESMATLVAFETLGYDYISKNNSLTTDEEKGQQLKQFAKASFGDEYSTFQKALGIDDKSTNEDIWKAAEKAYKQAQKVLKESDQYKQYKFDNVTDFVHSMFDSSFKAEQYVEKTADGMYNVNEEAKKGYNDYADSVRESALTSQISYTSLMSGETEKGILKNVFGARDDENASQAIARNVLEGLNSVGESGNDLATKIANVIMYGSSAGSQVVQNAVKTPKTVDLSQEAYDRIFAGFTEAGLANGVLSKNMNNENNSVPVSALQE